MPIRRRTIGSQNPGRLIPPACRAGVLVAAIGWSANHAASASAAPVIYAVVGDFGNAVASSSDAARELAVANMIASWNPNYVLTVGDNNYGTAAQWDANIGAYYGQYIKAPTGQTPGNRTATVNTFYPVLGNHDWDAGVTSYTDYFELPTNPSGNERYYETQLGDVRLFAYDSDPREPDGISAGTTQATWLQSRLQASTAKWNFVAMHHPPYSSGDHGNTAEVQLPYKLWGAQAVLTGHDHDLERIITGGLPYFVSGSGGREPRTFPNIVAGSQFRNNTDNGALGIITNGDFASFLFVASTGGGGTILDTYTIDRTLPSAATLTFRQGLSGYTGVHDTIVRLDSPNTANSATNPLVVDLDDDPGGVVSGNASSQAVIRFDSLFGSGSGQVPAGSTIASATLSIFTGSNANDQSADTISLYKLAVPFTDATTWNSVTGGFTSGEYSSTPDGSYAAPALSSQVNFDVTATLQAWLDGATNYGWVLLNNGTDGWRFNSSEYATDATRRPTLTITLAVANHAWAAAAATASWSSASSWDSASTPASNWNVSLANDKALTARQATVSADSTVNTIHVGGTTGPMVLRVENNATLTATTRVQIGAYGKVELAAGGNLSTPQIQVDDDGALQVSGGVPLVTNSLIINGTSGNPNAKVTIDPAGGELNRLTSLTMSHSGGAWDYADPLRTYYSELDLKSNNMAIRAASGTGMAMWTSDVLPAVVAGFNSGSFGNKGITSSTAAAAANTVLAAIINDDGSSNVLFANGSDIGAEFASLGAMTTDDIIIKYTYYGDLNLDGVVNGFDQALMDIFFGTPNGGWLMGDINYDGNTNGFDQALLDIFFGSGTGGAFGNPLSETGSGATSIPEPATLMVLLPLAGWGLLARRRGPVKSI